MSDDRTALQEAADALALAFPMLAFTVSRVEPEAPDELPAVSIEVPGGAYVGGFGREGSEWGGTCGTWWAFNVEELPSLAAAVEVVARDLPARLARAAASMQAQAQEVAQKAERTTQALAALRS